MTFPIHALSCETRNQRLTEARKTTLMSRINNDAAPIDANQAPSAGSVTSPFARENLVSSQHPALRPSIGNSAGGAVFHPAKSTLEAAGGPAAKA
jgi:hypothetical protein